MTPADALRAAINVLRDSAECRRMPSGEALNALAADVHADAADLLERLRLFPVSIIDIERPLNAAVVSGLVDDLDVSRGRGT